ncbi:Lipopolysaccharide assembly protein A [Halomonadaceae bacterium LMG 33818]|uniref:lipopolysaccharide assembly protein LapA domain-containing protein n=1 Tax=Cernens ardua TaxID=3402176 RepID=UPI003EDBCD03
MRLIKGLFSIVVAIIVLVIGILFVIRNQETVPLDVIWTKLPAASLALWLLACLVIGVIIGMLAMSGLYIRLRARIHRANKEIKHKQSEIDQLKANDSRQVQPAPNEGVQR